MSPLLVQEIQEDPPSAGLPTEIQLTPVEATLRTLLLDVAAYIDTHPAPPSTNPSTQVALPDDLAREPLTLRFTGGWVRDRLLGVQSKDIDVAINKLTGYHFGLRMKEYLSIPGNAERYGLDGIASSASAEHSAGVTDKSKTVGGLHKIEANPEKSKHLETVTTRLLGLDIDLVNLRKETYTSDSRNPAIEFGTPEEDALRRDATVNAMFYNLNTSLIEDFTGRGRSDLQRGILRTPLDAYQTFTDDPLRVLRLVRFASRLRYTIDPAALEAMREEPIKEALRRKISRERIGVEMEKALRGPDPYEALRLIGGVGLYGTVFTDPTAAAAAGAAAGTEHDYFYPDTSAWNAVISYLSGLINTSGPLEHILVKDAEDRFLAWQLAALIPYRDAPQPEPTEPGRKAPPPLASAVAREGVKATNKVCDVVTAAVRNLGEIRGCVDLFYQQQRRRPDRKVVEGGGQDAGARDILGMAIRRWGASWRNQVVYAMLAEVADDPGAASSTYYTHPLPSKALYILTRYGRYRAQIHNLHNPPLHPQPPRSPHV